MWEHRPGVLPGCVCGWEGGRRQPHAPVTRERCAGRRGGMHPRTRCRAFGGPPAGITLPPGPGEQGGGGRAQRRRGPPDPGREGRGALGCGLRCSVLGRQLAGLWAPSGVCFDPGGWGPRSPRMHESRRRVYRGRAASWGRLCTVNREHPAATAVRTRRLPPAKQLSPGTTPAQPGPPLSLCPGRCPGGGV